MPGDPTARPPEAPRPPPMPEGAGIPSDPDPAAEAERQEIERQVYERRTAPDKRAEEELAPPSPNVGEA